MPDTEYLQKCKKLENEIDKLKKENERYLEYLIQFLALILKYQAEDISKEQLFAETKAITRPDVYNPLYHKIVTKDYLGLTFSLEHDIGNDIADLDDTDTLVILDGE